MKAFWWFRENSIAGMARPGFNSTPWLELAFDEAILLGWLGQFSESSSQSIDGFIQHVKTYGPKIGKFHKVSDGSFADATKAFYTDAGIQGVLDRLTERTQIFKGGRAAHGRIHFEFNDSRLMWEIDYLKKQGIGSIITLTERHHSREVLKNHFDVHHFSIEDLNAPTFEQAQDLAEIIRGLSGKKMAAHCLAGIGRTSTMLMSAHMILGEDQSDIEALLKKQNPAFALTGSQQAFVRSVAERISRKQY